MMDLADIRKKARHSKNARPVEVVVEKRETDSTKTVQGLPSPPLIESASDKSLDVPPADAVSSAKDVLEEFFGANHDMDALFGEEGLQDRLLSDSGDGDVLRQWLCFALGDEEYAIDIADIREIVKPREITDIPRVPDFVLGIISLRGIIIPIFDLKRRLNLGTTDLDSDSRIIVCQQKDRNVGLLVDRIAQVVRISDRAIEPPPAILSGVDKDFVEGVGRSQDRMMILLCLTNVLDAELI